MVLTIEIFFLEQPCYYGIISETSCSYYDSLSLCAK